MYLSKTNLAAEGIDITPFLDDSFLFLGKIDRHGCDCFAAKLGKV